MKVSVLKGPISLVSLFLINSLAQAAPTTLNSIAAKVNDDIITTQQLEQQVLIIQPKLKAVQADIPALATLKKQVLETMINKILFIQFANRLHLTVNDTEIQAALSSIAKQNKMKLPELLNAVHQQGLSTSDYVAQIRYGLLMEQVKRIVIVPNIVLQENEIDTYLRSFNQQRNRLFYHLKEIIIPLPDQASAAQTARLMQYAHDLSDKINANTDFADLARSESKAQGLAIQSRNLDRSTLVELPPVLANAVATMQIGDVSEPLHTRYDNSLHVLLLMGVSSNASNSPKLTRDEVADILLKRKMNTQFNFWLQRLHRLAYIEIMVPSLQ